MYNTQEHRNTRKSIHNSLKKETISQKDKNEIYRRMTNERVAKCNKACGNGEEGRENERGRIGSCVVTNTTIGLKDCTHPDGKTRYHYIRPTELAVDTLQWAFNTGKAKIIKDERSSEYFLTLNNFPTLTVEIVKNENGEYRDTRRGDEEDKGFFYAYEDADTLQEFGYDAQLAEYMKGYDPKGDGRSFYKAMLMYKEMDTPDTPENYRKGWSTQDITYVRYVADFLMKACDYNTERQIYINPDKTMGLECELAGINRKYIIVESVIVEGDGEYVICGYPDPSKMRTYFKMLEENHADFANIHSMHRTEFAKLFAEMHNSATSDIEMQINLETLENKLYKFSSKNANLDYLETWLKQNELLDITNPNAWLNKPEFQEKMRFMRENGLEEHLTRVMSEIKNTLLPAEERVQQLEQLSAVKDKYNLYINALLMEYLNKVMMRVRYYFLIYKRQADGLLVPAVFNIKQLEAKHTFLLKRVLELIQIMIPKIYGLGILEQSRNGIEKYKIFHSYIRDGDFFYITTEYLHIMANLSHYSYIYEISRELEEIIYASSRLNDLSKLPFYHELKVKYQIKQHRIKHTDERDNPPTKIEKVKNNTLSQNNTLQRNNRDPNKSKKSRNINENKTIDLANSKQLRGKVILIYERVYQEYTIIFKDVDGIFRVLVIKSNMLRQKNDIMQIIKLGREIYKCNDAVYRAIDFPGRLFQVKSYRILKPRDLEEIKKQNPLVPVRYIIHTEPKITIEELLKTELLSYEPTTNTNTNTKEKQLEILNGWRYKPIMYFNLVFNSNYLQALQNGKEFGILKNYKEQGNLIYGVNEDVHCIINPENCGYNFVEISEPGKIVVWILPYGYRNISTYIKNFADLNRIHLPLLNTIQQYYQSRKMLCYLHITTTNMFGLLHFHVVKNDKLSDNYKRIHPHDEKGTWILREISLEQLIHNIKNDSNYYSEFNIPIIKKTEII
jgi:hypothetical protein